MNFIKILLLLIVMINFTSCKKDYEEQGLLTVDSFGENKGNLNMYYHKPVNEMANLPLVIVLHGCTQTAKLVAEDTYWNKLADKYGFYIVYPEQKTINNITSCFNWFLKADNEKNKGEASSIKEMTDYMIDEFKINSSKIYLTGLSAGGAIIGIGESETQGGQSSSYTKDVNYFSSYWIADFFWIVRLVYYEKNN